MFKYLFPLYLWLNIALVFSIIPWLFISENPGSVLFILIFLIITLLPAAFELIIKENYRKKRFLHPSLIKELKSRGTQSKKNFLASFPSKQHLLASSLRNTLAGNILVSPKYLHHDTPIMHLPLMNVVDTVCFHSQYFGSLAPHLKDKGIWWIHHLEYLRHSNSTLKDLVQFFTNLENRLGEVLADVEIPATRKGVGGEEGEEME